MNSGADTLTPGDSPVTQPAADVDRPGRRVRRILTGFLLFVGDMAVVLARGLLPGNWRRTMRDEFVRQFVQIGVRAVPAVVVIAVMVGLGLVLQMIYWLGLVSQGGSVGSFLVLLLVREIAPVLAALVVIGRSGAVMLDEVGHLNANGQIRMLRSHGIDPVDFVVMPRCFATALALFVLTVILVYTALVTGFLGAAIAGLTSVSTLDFADDVLSNMGLGDHLLLLAKPLATGFVLGGLGAWFGMRVQPSAVGVRRMLPTAFVISLVSALVIGIALSAVL